MTSAGAWTQTPDAAAFGASAPVVTAEHPRLPRYALLDFPALLWRERHLMIAVFLLIFALGIAAALTLKTVYSAQSSLLVRLGQEYVYEPRAGDAARGAVPDSGQVISSEVEILSSAQLKQRVIDRIGLDRLYPDLADGYDQATPAERRKIDSKAIATMAKTLSIGTVPDSPVVRISFSHPNPEMAAKVLNTLLDEYLVYRRTILLDPTAPLSEQRKAFEARLAQADQAYENFLNSNNIGDFEAEKTGLNQLAAALQQQKYTTQAQLDERQGRLASLNSEAAGVTPEVGLSRDVNTAPNVKLLDLKLQREALLSRYKPDARPVQDLDVQIAGLEKMISAGQAAGDSGRRIGANPVYQTLQTDRIQLTAEVAALQSSVTTLAQQIDQVTQRQLRLVDLEPKYAGLARDRDVLSANVKDFTVKEQQTQASDAIARKSNDNISVVERAVVPVQGKSLKRPVAVLAFLLAGFTALCAGLLRVFLRPGFATAALAGRTLDLPVLGAARAKGR